MKDTPQTPPRLLLSLLCLLVSLLANPARGADTQAWNPSGTTSIGGSGTWDTTSALWTPANTQTQVDSGSLVTFIPGNAALFCAGPSGSANQGTFTITVSGTISIGGLFNGQLNPGPCTLTLNDGELSLASGICGFGIYNNTTTINSLISGSGTLNPQSSGTLVLKGNNTYSGGTLLTGGGLQYFNNNSAFGTGPIGIQRTSGNFCSLLGQGGALLTLANDFTNNISGGGINFAADANTPVTSTGNWNLGANSVNIRNSCATGPLTLAGVISGSANLTLSANNAGSTIVLSGANTYSGSTTLGAGGVGVIAQVSSINSVSGGVASSSLGAPTTAALGTLAIGGGASTATLVYTGPGETSDRAISLAGTSGGATIEMDGTGPLVLSSASTITSGMGSKTLTLQGSSTANNQFSGVIVDNGTTGKTSLAANFSANATTITLASVDGLTNGAAISGTGIPANDTVSSFNATTKVVTLKTKASGAGTAGQAITCPPLVNITSVTKAGSGTWVLSGANTYSGNTTVSAGTLVQGAANSIPYGTKKGNFASSAGATFDLNGISCQLNGFAGTSAGNIDNVSAGGNVTLTLGNNNASGTQSGVIANTTGTLTLVKTGTGNISLSGANTYSGGTTIGSGGSLQISTDGALGAIPASPVVNVTLDGGTLKNNGTGTTPSVDANRSIYLTANGGYFDAGWSGPPPNPITINGQITGPGFLGINQDGSPVVLMNPANNWTGNTYVGTKGPNYYNNANAWAWLQLGANNVLPTGAGAGDLYVTNAVQKNMLDLAGFSATINGLWGDAFVNNTVGGASTLTVGNNDASSTFSGVISNYAGTVALTKIGAGTLTLSGANTFSGATTVSAGTLVVRAASGLASTLVTVASAAGIEFDAATALPATATLVINVGSSVKLNYFGGLQLASLSLDGGATTVSAGTWGAPGSGAVNTDSRLSGTGILNVGIAPPSSVTLNSSAAPSTYGGSVTFTCVATGGGATPTGTITFRDGATVLATVLLDGTGTATLTTNTLNAATHSISAAYTGDLNYGATLATFSQVVNQAALTVTADNQTKTYGDTVTFGAGSTQFTSGGLQNNETIGSVTLAVSGNGGAATAPLSGSPYTITPSAATGGTFNSANYTITYATGTLTVSAARLTVSASGLLTYGNDPSNTVYSPSYSGLLNGDTASVVSGSANFSTDATATNYIGTNFIAHVVDLGNLTSANYAFVVGPDGVTTITNRPLFVTNALASDKVYDATATAVVDVSGAGLTNLVNGDDASVSLVTTSATGAFSDKSVASGKTVTISGLSTAGDLGTNYVLIAPTTTASITPAALTVSATGVDKTYDGKLEATVTLAATPLAGDSVTPQYGTATFATKNVGTGLAVSVSGITLAGTDAGNYTANTTADTTATITARPLTVSATGSNKVYDGGLGTSVTLADDRIAGDDVSESYGSAAFADKNVATGIAVSVSGISLSGGADASNYSLASTTASTTANITARTLTVTATGVNKVYDGTTAATVTLADDKVAGDEVSESYTAATFADANVGTAKAVNVNGISLSGTAAGNYSLANPTATTSADITAAASSTALASSANPSTVSSNVTFTATVSSSVGTPTGDVVFLANGVPFSTNTLVAGVAEASTASLPAGNNAIVAQYATQANWLLSSATLQQVMTNAIVFSQTNAVLSFVANGNGTYTLNLLGTPGASYYVVSSANIAAPMTGWSALTDSTNTAPIPEGRWSVVVSNAAPAFYRAVAVNPAPVQP